MSEHRFLMMVAEKMYSVPRCAALPTQCTGRSRAEQRLEEGVAIHIAQFEQVGAVVQRLRPGVGVRVEIRGAF